MRSVLVVIVDIRPDLLGSPPCGRVLGHVEVKDSAPLEAQDKEYVDEAKPYRRHDSEINCEGVVQMIVQKGRPSLPRTRGWRELRQIARNGDFRNLDSELEQLPMNSTARVVRGFPPGGIR